MMTGCRLYLISPPSFEISTFAKQLAEALSGGDVAAFQLRMKDVARAEIKKAAQTLLPICKEKKVAFLVNDDWEMALEIGADGVHLGYEDGIDQQGFIEKLREKLPEEFVIGTSCYDSKHIAMETAEQGADYVSFGAFFPSKTKVSKGNPKPDILEWWSEFTEIPCVAIGGITPENCGILVKAGANFIAVISYVWEHPEGPKKAVAEFNSMIAKAAPNC